MASMKGLLKLWRDFIKGRRDDLPQRTDLLGIITKAHERQDFRHKYSLSVEDDR
jgi:hypothetical protein